MRKRSVLWLSAALFLTAMACYFALGESARAAAADAVWPQASGTVVQTDKRLIIDARNIDKGYVMACVSEPTSHRMRLRVSYGSAQLMYEIDNNGMYVTYPLQLGSGNYVFELFDNVKGSKYSAAGKISLAAQLGDENASFLVPNQYVDYDLYTAAVQKSDEICTDPSQNGVYSAVTSFIASEFAYDFVRAKTIGSGELPDIDYCYANRMGICQDLSAVMVCMLRAQGVPARLMIGYADSYYHAWTTAVVNGQEMFFDPTVAIGALNAKKYQTERYY